MGNKIILVLLSLLIAVTLCGAASAADKSDIYVNTYVNSTNYTPNYDSEFYITIAAKNKGPNNATGVIITDKLPNELTYISDNSNGAYNPSTGEWYIGNLFVGTPAAGGSYADIQYMDILVRATTANAVFTNTARLTHLDQTDASLSNNNKTRTFTVGPASDIAVTSSAPSTPNFGDMVTITINAKNNGPNTANGVKITSILPSGLKFISSNGDYNAATGVWNVGTVANGATSTLEILAQVNGTSGILNLVSNKTAENEYDYNLTNDLNTTTLTITLGNQVTFTDVDDGNSGQITLPFTVNLFGRSYNSFYINVNGLVSFDSAMSEYIPNPSKNGYVAAFWDDVYLTAGGAVYYRVTDNMVTITWVKVPSYLQRNNPSLFNTFQIRIVRNATTGATTYGFVYGDMQWKVGYNGGSAFAGFGGYKTNKQNSHTYTTFWTSSSPLTQIAYQTFWFSSAGELIT